MNDCDKIKCEGCGGGFCQCRPKEKKRAPAWFRKRRGFKMPKEQREKLKDFMKNAKQQFTDRNAK